MTAGNNCIVTLHKNGYWSGTRKGIIKKVGKLVHVEFKNGDVKRYSPRNVEVINEKLD